MILALQLRTSADSEIMTVGIRECNFFVNLPVGSGDWINHKPVVQIVSARGREGTSILKSAIAVNLKTKHSKYNTNSRSKLDVFHALSIETSSTLHSSPFLHGRLDIGCLRGQVTVDGWKGNLRLWAFAANKLQLSTKLYGDPCSRRESSCQSFCGQPTAVMTNLER